MDENATRRRALGFAKNRGEARFEEIKPDYELLRWVAVDLLNLRKELVGTPLW